MHVFTCSQKWLKKVRCIIQANIIDLAKPWLQEARLQPGMALP